MAVTHVKASDVKDMSYKPINELDQDTDNIYDPKLFEGAPVSLQLTGRSFCEEQLLAVAQVLDLTINA
jgi:amidase